MLQEQITSIGIFIVCMSLADADVCIVLTVHTT